MERYIYVIALLMATCTVIHGLPHLSLEGTEIQVRGRSADFESARDRRSADEFPTRISVDLTSSDISTHLDLQQNADITDNVPVLLWRDNMVKRYRVKETERVAFYEDVDHGAAIMVSFNKNNNSEDEFLYFGTFMTEDGERLIQPSDEINNKYTISEIEMPEIASMDFKINPNYDQHKRPVHSSDIPSRQKRNVIVYEVEIFFVVDYAIYLNWYEKTVGEADRVSTTFSLIKQYYAFVLNAIDLRYQSVTGHGFNISCLYAGIYIADTPTGALFVEENTFDVSLPVLAVDIDTVLTAFSAWAETFLAPTYYYDHAMLLTGYEAGYISGGQFSTSVAGLAFTPGACTESRYSIGEDINFDSGIGTLMAHELGHNLGSLHDNETENDCFQNDGYVMAPSSGYAGNVEIDRRAYLFSVCSNIYFNDYIDIMNNGGYNCLTSRDANYDVTDLDPYINDIAGQVYSPDQQCEEKYGAGSFLYRSVYNSFEDICTNLYCANPTTDGSYYTTLPWDGTTCGSGKLCRAGYCVASDSVPTVDNEACLFGDVPYTVPFSNPPMTCAELITNSTSYNCYQSSFYESCCSSCEAIRQVESTNCQYGDQAEWCSTLSLFDCYLNDHICCQSCPERSTGIENCQYGDQAEWCSTLSLFDCYANDHICCQSCPERSTGIENCEYGDKATGCETITPSGCTVNGDTCCETCYVPPSTTTSTTTTTTSTTTSTTSTTTSTTPSTTSTTITPTTTSTTSTTSTTTSTTPSTTTTTSTTPTTTSTTSTTTSTTPLTTSTSSTTPLTTTTTSTPSTATTTSTTMSTTSTLPPTTTTITSSTTEGIVKRIVGVKFIFQIDLGNQDINDELIINVRIELTQYYIRTMGNKFIRIIEITLRKGSLIADYKVEMDDTPESSADFTKANLDLVKAEETVTILNKTVSPSSVTINDVTVTNETVSNDENVCQLLIGTKTCADGLECVVTDGNPSCQKIDDKFGLTLVIVAVVAAVVLLFVILGIACLVARMYCGDRKTKYPDSYSTDTLDDSRQYTGYKYPGMAFYGGMNGHHGEKAQGYVSNTREIIPTSHSNRNSRSHHSKDNSYRDNRYSNKRQKSKSPSRPSSKTSNQHRHVYDNRALDYDQILSASYVEPYDRR